MILIACTVSAIVGLVIGFLAGCYFGFWEGAAIRPEVKE